MLKFLTVHGEETELKAEDLIVWDRQTFHLYVFRGPLRIDGGTLEGLRLMCRNEGVPGPWRDSITMLVSERDEFIPCAQEVMNAIAKRVGLGTRWWPEKKECLVCVLTKDMPC